MKKIVACLDCMNGRVIKGVNFVDFKDAGDPAENAKFYSENGADEIVLLDISATNENRDTIIDVVKDVAENINVPFAVGGGIKNKEDARRVLEAGANRISVNSAAVRNPDIINEISGEFGKEKLVVAIDSKKDTDGKHYIYINGGKKKTDIDTFEWAKEAKKRGAGAILVTSIDGDGTKEGYDLELTRKIKEAVGDIEVIASGGAGCLEDFYKAFTEGCADSALAASLFHFKEVDIMDLKNYLKGKGVL